MTCSLGLLISLSGCGKRMSTANSQEAAQQASSRSSAPQNERQKAEQEIRLLPPSAFPELPVEAIKQLQHRGCTVPQVSGIPELHNVIRGQFARRGQTNWAVLCLKDGKSCILIFSGKPNGCPNELACEENESFIQMIGDGRMGYSRKINAVSSDYILEHYKRYGGPVPPRLDHQGIDDGVGGKASHIHYCYQGKWLTLTGAD